MLGPRREHVLERVLVGAQVLVALAHRRQVVDHGRRHRGLELAVASLRELGLDVRGVHRAHGREDLDQVAHAGLLRVAAHVAARVGDCAFELALDHARLVEHVHRSLLAGARRRHLAGGILQVHHARAHRRDAVLWNHQHLLPAAEAGVEAPRDIAHQLQVLALVLAHGDLVGAVGEHVGSLQHRIAEQRRRDELALGQRLVAELVHALQPPELGDGGQKPRQLGVLVHVALAKQRAALGIEARRDQHGGGVVAARAQLGRLIRDGDRVQVHDAEDALAALLAGDVLHDRADVVAQVLAPRGLDAGEDAHARGPAAGYSAC